MKELTVWNQIHLYRVDSGLFEIQSPYLMTVKRKSLERGSNLNCERVKLGDRS